MLHSKHMHVSHEIHAPVVHEPKPFLGSWLVFVIDRLYCVFSFGVQLLLQQNKNVLELIHLVQCVGGLFFLKHFHLLGGITEFCLSSANSTDSEFLTFPIL